jgi:hypothetical protein
MRAPDTGKDHKELSMSAKQKRTIAAASALLLLIGSWVLAGCGGSEPADITKGPGLLYFYAEW